MQPTRTILVSVVNQCNMQHKTFLQEKQKESHNNQTPERSETSSKTSIFLPLLNAFLSSLLAFLPPLQIFQNDDSLTVILLLLLFGFGSAMKKLEGPLFLPKRRKAAFYRCMRCVALSLEASGQGKGSVAEKRSVDLSA